MIYKVTENFHDKPTDVRYSTGDLYLLDDAKRTKVLLGENDFKRAFIEEVKPDALTVDELKHALDYRKVEYKATATKKELVNLLGK